LAVLLADPSANLSKPGKLVVNCRNVTVFSETGRISPFMKIVRPEASLGNTMTFSVRKLVPWQAPGVECR
jgi:hypothetical protein